MTNLGLLAVIALAVPAIGAWKAARHPAAAEGSIAETNARMAMAPKVQAEPWPPFMNFFPDGGTYTPDDDLPNDSLAVTIVFCDDSALVGSRRAITYNGTNVTSQFTYVTLSPDFQCGAKAQSEGKVRLVEGANKLKAQIGDGNLKGADSTSYFYKLHSYGVGVGPRNRTIRVRPSLATTERFVVTNMGSTTVSFGLTASCVTPATNCSAGTSTASLAPGASDTISVSFTAASSGSGGQVKLKATRTNGDGTTSADSGMVTVELGSEGAPTVSIAEDNPGTAVARDRCVTFALGSGAASECGDLRLVHALPSTRTLGRDRTPTLIYNSTHAVPSARVAARVDMPTVARPDEVEATLTLNGTAYTRKWDGTDWGSSAAQRVTAVVTGLTLPTGVYPFSLVVRSRYGTNYHPAGTKTGQLVVVNRSASPFGSGWWLAGLEGLTVFANGDSILWVGGDGSTRVYAKAGTDRLLAPTLDLTFPPRIGPLHS